MKLNIYEYNSFKAFFSTWLEYLKHQNSKHSVRWLAKRLNLKSHAYLLRLAAGEKTISNSLLNKLAGLMDLSVDEFSYLRNLAELSRSKSQSERAFIFDKMESLRGEGSDILMQLDEFELIAHWYHLVIFEMIKLPNFNADAKWIASRLRGTVSTEAVKESLRILEKLGLIARDGDKYVRKVGYLNTTNNVPSSAIRLFHREMLERAGEALTEVPVDKRCFLSHTMLIDSRNLDAAMNLMTEFRQKFHKLMTTDTPDRVYQLGLQFIPVAKTDQEVAEEATTP